MELTRKNIHNDFIEKLERLTGENVYACYQCGKCSTGCPMIEHMDILPHTIMRWLQLGQEKAALESNTSWYCASCLQCMAKCPQGIDVAKIMDTLRDILKRKGVDKMELSKIAEEMWKKMPQQGLVSGFRKFSS